MKTKVRKSWKTGRELKAKVHRGHLNILHREKCPPGLHRAFRQPAARVLFRKLCRITVNFKSHDLTPLPRPLTAQPYKNLLCFGESSYYVNWDKCPVCLTMKIWTLNWFYQHIFYALASIRERLGIWWVPGHWSNFFWVRMEKKETMNSRRSGK